MSNIEAYQREILACQVIEFFRDENPGRELNFSDTERTLTHYIVESGAWPTGGRYG